MHELGYVALRHRSLVFLGDNMVRDPIHEIESNAFAAKLLIRKNVLFAKGPMTSAQIKSFCCVSLEATTIRARRLGGVNSIKIGDLPIPHKILHLVHSLS